MCDVNPWDDTTNVALATYLSVVCVLLISASLYRSCTDTTDKHSRGRSSTVHRHTQRTISTAASTIARAASTPIEYPSSQASGNHLVDDQTQKKQQNDPLSSFPLNSIYVPSKVPAIVIHNHQEIDDEINVDENELQINAFAQAVMFVFCFFVFFCLLSCKDIQNVCLFLFFLLFLDYFGCCTFVCLFCLFCLCFL